MLGVEPAICNFNKETNDTVCGVHLAKLSILLNQVALPELLIQNYCDQLKLLFVYIEIRPHLTPPSPTPGFP